MNEEYFYFKVITEEEVRVYNGNYTILIKDRVYKVKLTLTNLETDTWKLELLNMAREVLVEGSIGPRRAFIDSSVQTTFFDTFTFWKAGIIKNIHIDNIEEKKKLIEEIPPVIINYFKNRGINCEDIYI